MADLPDLDLPDNPQLVANITHFARALRRAGLPIGPGRVIDAIAAVAAAGFSEKRDFYWTLHACFVSRTEHRQVFAQVFRLYWRDPRYLEHMMSLMLPALRGAQQERIAAPAEKRAAEALLDGLGPRPPERTEDDDDTEVEIDASATASASERLRTLDFEQMSTSEIAAAQAAIARLALPVRPLPARRLHADAAGRRADGAATLRAAMRRGGEVARIARRSPRPRWPDLVALCDISGSMSVYSRVVLHFLHALSARPGRGWGQVQAFTFGTRLTPITRHLAARDVDAALAAAGAQAQDWQGGTRIGACLRAFNRDWSRRCLGPGAVVLLITDGLDRDDPALLGAEMERLHLSARRVVWVNPLLRWEGFAPRAAGIRAMLPHVDCLRAGHSIAALEDLAAVLSQTGDAGEKPRLMAALRAAAG
ncbi:vWA domain-containing protein [Rhodobaculum claviforme]|uniref:VWA domain-containing protein n=1 Tax=Rhodobaculum claviforme TaxID=1549854 RepID=A0A934WE25_9RHOB|nr:VWA domain-containing protein [Rhodobaculum claviforme]MBK5925965.1 VWA domain-containing protein [Rhodobaculum claviforme]